MKSKKILILICSICILITMSLAGCGGKASTETGEAPQIKGLEYESTVDLEYANQFAIHKYKGGYVYIDVIDDAQYLVIPEGGKIPDGLDESVKVIKQPLDSIYLGATASMALFDKLDALDQITMTELKEEGWTIDNARKAMASGQIAYAGKYNQPDYEMILDKNCDLAIESTMIYHSPDVKEMLEELGITVLVDRSSYEANPLGRTEWIKLYGVLCGKEDKAEEFFASQKDVIKELEGFKNTGKTVAYFYVSTDGKVVVRSSSDYVPTMIDMAGGKYIFDDLTDKDGRSSIPMTMESFYDKASEVDYIIYNGSIDGTVKTIEDLKEKDEIFKSFKAVKEGRCYNTGSSVYQRTDVISSMIMDFHKMLTEDDASDMQFMTKME